MTALHGAELHSGDTWHYRAEFDLHVVRIATDGASTAVVVEEYQFPLHVPADAWLDVTPAVAR